MEFVEREEGAVIHEVEQESAVEQESGLGSVYNFSDDMFLAPVPETTPDKAEKDVVEEQSRLEQISPQQLRSLQLTDPTLEEWRRQADEAGVGDFCWRDGLLNRKPWVVGGEWLLAIP